MTCHPIHNRIVCTSGKFVRIGRYLVEMHSSLGPILLREDGAPRKRQPGPRSAFWPAFQQWFDAQQKDTSHAQI